MRPELGTYGVFANPRQLDPAIAAELESLGYGTLWVGGSPSGDLEVVERLLEATSSLVLATGIVNIWKDDAATVAASFHRIQARFPDRFLLGIGAGHPEQNGEQYQKPYDALVRYLDELDANGVPAEQRVLAALGPRVLRLAAARTAGAHPYLTTPAHTQLARSILGPGVLLAPEHKVVLVAEREIGRSVGRTRVEKPYLGLSNYVSNLRRLGTPLPTSTVRAATGSSTTSSPSRQLRCLETTQSCRRCESSPASCSEHERPRPRCDLAARRRPCVGAGMVIPC